jgi:hypothetical protein
MPETLGKYIIKINLSSLIDKARFRLLTLLLATWRKTGWCDLERACMWPIFYI